MIVAAIDELLVLGADPPGVFRLLAGDERGEGADEPETPPPGSNGGRNGNGRPWWKSLFGG